MKERNTHALSEFAGTFTMASFTYEVNKKSFMEMFKDHTDGKDATDDDFDNFCVLFGDGGKRAFALAEEALDMWANQCVNDVASAREEKWQDVYNCGQATQNAKAQTFYEASSFDVPCDPKYSGFLYYETHKGMWKNNSLVGDYTEGYITNGKALLKASRSWMSGAWDITEIEGTLAFRHGDWKEGRPNQVKVTLSE